MITVPLIALNQCTEQQLSSECISLETTMFAGNLPTLGITLAVGIPSFKKVLEQLQAKESLESTPSVCRLTYLGKSQVPKTSVLTLDEVKKSDYVTLSSLARDAREPIFQVVQDFINEKAKIDATVLDSLIAIEAVKPSTIHNIRLKKTKTFSVIASYPEVIDRIHTLAEFCHLDAIVYAVKCDDYMAEMITIFNDANIALAEGDGALESRYIDGGISHFESNISLASAVAATGKMMTIRQHNEYLEGHLKTA